MKSVLLGEMSDAVRADLCMALAGHFHVHCVGNGQALVAALAVHNPDTLVLDFDSGGFDALFLIRDLRDRMRVVMLLPHQPPVREQCELAQLGINVFVGKSERLLLSKRTRPVANLGQHVLSACTETELLHDPQEDDPILGPIIESANARADAAVGTSDLGSCHRVWGEMKRILQSEYGIDWKSPTDMNPGHRFD